jgi:FixJ family two-component response regulator
MYFYFMEGKIEEMEQRLAELEPAVRESEALKESIASLKRILAEQKTQEGDLDAGDEEGKGYMRLPARKAQIAEILSISPDLTNQQIADRLGLTAARVSQIRSAMAAEEGA